ncbi:PREDICTED: reticulon-like protein B21 [Prunus mume]|uniref:Reticulon-like protein n=1 Tax=Prunus mume TaxID=102107 RepID=A0ABM0PQI3_PRUMU|nr:PREDICTED: reticulon-like protein B21 [Prunus mume]
MDVGRRRDGVRSGVVAGSVWESRMKIDEVKGGIKVFNGDQENSEDQSNASNGVAGTRTRSKRGQAGGALTAAGKRKTWKSDTSEGFEKNPIQISKAKTESLKNSDQQCKELSVSVDGIKKSPTQLRRLRSEASKEIGAAASDKNERSSVGIRKPRNELLKSASDLGEASVGIEKNSAQLRKVKSECNKRLDASGNAIQLGKEKSESNKALDESDKEIDTPVEVIEKSPVEIENSGSEENCKEFGVCQEMVISSGESNVDVLKSDPKASVHDGDDQEGDEEDDGDELEEEVDEEIEVEVEKKSVDIKEVNATEEKLTTKVVNEEKVVKVNEVKKLLHLDRKEVKKLYQVHQNQKPEPISLNLTKPLPVIKRATVHSNIPKQTSFAASNEYHNHTSFQETHSRLQSLVDLIMWKDISRSVFVFGMGAFVILSSSYTKDLNISFISVISYMGLLYLGAIFLFKSIICRGAVEVDNANYVVGEEEAMWLLKLVLPYLNELLLKMKALFSGDPATTIKLAVLLFVLARCGSSITIWTMSKVGFFGVFTLPKVCSLYSAQLTVYAKFWIRRFRDAWESCTHKKALTVAIFLLVWNLSSVVARIWAAFILVVAFRYYQQKLVTEEWVEEEEEEEEEYEDDAGGEEKWEEALGAERLRQRHVQSQVDNNITKPKKDSR